MSIDRNYIVDSVLDHEKGFDEVDREIWKKTILEGMDSIGLRDNTINAEWFIKLHRDVIADYTAECSDYVVCDIDNEPEEDTDKGDSNE